MENAQQEKGGLCQLMQCSWAGKVLFPAFSILGMTPTLKVFRQDF